MLFEKTKPDTLERSAVFNHDSILLIGFSIFGILCQLWSGWTEYFGFSSFLADVLESHFPVYAGQIGSVLAFLLAFTLEVCVFALVTYVVNSFYGDYLQRTGQLGKTAISNWIKFSLALVILVFLVGVSATVSKTNAENELRVNAPKPQTTPTQPLTAQEQQQVELAQESYKEDLNTSTAAHQSRKTAVNRLFDSQIAEKTAEIGEFREKERKTGRKYTSRINRLSGKIRELEVERAEKLEELEREFQEKLAAFKDSRDKRIAEIRADVGKDKAKLRNDNARIDSVTTARNEWLAGFLKRYAQYSVFGFVAARTWVCIALQTAGIKPLVYVRAEWFTSSVFRDLFTLILTFLTRYPQNWIRRQLKRLPPLEVLPTGEGAFIQIPEKDREDPPPPENEEKPPCPNEYDELLDELLETPLNGKAGKV